MFFRIFLLLVVFIALSESFTSGIGKRSQRLVKRGPTDSETRNTRRDQGVEDIEKKQIADVVDIDVRGRKKKQRRNSRKKGHAIF